MASHLVYPCLQDYNGGNIFFLSLQNATMDDLNKIGMEQVEQGIIQAIAHAANFSVLRLTHFMLTQMDEKLLACFVISEKSSVETPAKTAYLQKELSVNEVHQLLNATINATNQFTMHIQLWILNRLDCGRAMFVLGFFMFIFGAVLVVGSFLFYSKRQSIRGMAYQVFE
uniref:DUF7959 domain-containing protein n=1 Tax=Ditylenchus dipsaci TaxID=166011 RepID=A0A915EPW6_9BILA